MVELVVDDGGKVLRCVFSGRMDTPASAADGAAVEARLAGLLPGGAAALEVVFDLEKVDYVTSAFFRVCSAVARQVPGRFSVARSTPAVKKVFHVAGLDSVFPVG